MWDKNNGEITENKRRCVLFLTEALFLASVTNVREWDFLLGLYAGFVHCAALCAWLEFAAAATHWLLAGLLPSEDPAGLTCLLSVRKLFEFNLFTLTLQEGANLWKGILSYILQCFLCCWPQMTRPPLQVTLCFLWLRVCVCVWAHVRRY